MIALPRNAKPNAVFATKNGSYSNAGLDMGQYDETRSLKVAISWEDDKIYGWYEFSRYGVGPDKTVLDGQGFGFPIRLTFRDVDQWASGLFRSFNIDEPRRWRSTNGSISSASIEIMFTKFQAPDYRTSSLKLARNLIQIAGDIREQEIRDAAVQAAREIILSDPENELDADDAILFCSSCAEKMRKDGTTIKAGVILDAIAAMR